MKESLKIVRVFYDKFKHVVKWQCQGLIGAPVTNKIM